MLYLPDTNACSHFFRGDPGLAARWADHIAAIRLSVVVLAELRYGATKAASSRQHQRIAALVAAVPVEPLTADDTEIYAELRARLEKRGERIGSLDLFIAAQSIRLGATTVTHNLREFRRVPGLRVEDWQTVP